MALANSIAVVTDKLRALQEQVDIGEIILADPDCTEQYKLDTKDLIALKLNKIILELQAISAGIIQSK